MNVDDLNEWVRGQRDWAEHMYKIASVSGDEGLACYHKGELSAFNRMLFELGVRRGE